MQDEEKKQPAPRPKQGSRQTDLAEGEPDTVEESLEIHEKKGDLPGRDH